MSDWSEWIGRTYEQADSLTPALLARFRATIDSDDRDAAAAQGIHWCLCLPETATADLGKDGHPHKGGFLPPIPLPRRMWASSQVEFHAPIYVGDAIAKRSAIAGVSEKTGSSGSLIFVDINHETRANGILAVSERQTLVYRETATAAAITNQDDTPLNLSEWDWHRRIIPAETMLFRYSALTFNSHRIHYDRPYAVETEHYIGIVVHGPLTATLLLDLAAQNLGSNQITQFQFRGQSPTFAGQALNLVGKIMNGGETTLAALGDDGRIIMTAFAQHAPRHS